MAPLDPTNTARLKIIYQNIIAQHATVIRVNDPDGVTEVESVFANYVANLAAGFFFHEITAVQLAAVGSDIFLDVAGSSLLSVTWGSDPASTEGNAVFAEAVGRSAGGRKVSFYLYGWKAASSSYRLTAAEDANVADAIGDLNGATDSFFAIDGLATVWKPYLNIKPGDHWVHKAR